MEGQLIHIRKLGFTLKGNGKLLKCIFLSYLHKNKLNPKIIFII